MPLIRLYWLWFYFYLWFGVLVFFLLWYFIFYIHKHSATNCDCTLLTRIPIHSLWEMNDHWTAFHFFNHNHSVISFILIWCLCGCCFVRSTMCFAYFDYFTANVTLLLFSLVVHLLKFVCSFSVCFATDCV